MIEETAVVGMVARGEHFGFPYSEHPSGWFQVAWSSDLAPGQVVPLRFFGVDLVCFRGEGGTPGVLDAFCPHMGAHLAFGAPGSAHEHGCVVGEDIQCPFHGWVWNRQGANVAIPYSGGPSSAVRIGSWPVHEAGGIILVWHDALRRPPLWDPPRVAELNDAGWFPLESHGLRRRISLARTRPQYVVENIVDIGHLRYVHNHAEHGRNPGGIADGAVFRASFECTYNTSRGPVGGRLENEAWGVGILVLRLSGIRDNVMFIATTPVEAESSDIFVSTTCARKAGEEQPAHLAQRIIEQQQQEVLNDLPLFVHQQYVPRAPFVPEEASAFVALRQWARQFYPDAGDTGFEGG